MLKFEVIFEPLDHIIAGGLLMDERHRVLPDGEFIHWLNKAMGRTDLFLYRHTETEMFVLAQWTSREPRVCIELDTWPVPPDWMQSQIEGEEFWKYRLVGAHEMVDRLHRQVREDAYEKRAAKQETGMQRQGAAKYLKKRGMEIESHLMEIGATPMAGAREAKLHGTGDVAEELKTDLLHAARRGD